MIPEPKGREITALLERNIMITLHITIGTRNLQKYVSRTSVVFVSISFIILMIISLAWLVFYYIQRFRYASARNRNQVRARFSRTNEPWVPVFCFSPFCFLWGFMVRGNLTAAWTETGSNTSAATAASVNTMRCHVFISPGCTWHSCDACNRSSSAGLLW